MRLYIIRHADPDYKSDTLTARGRLEAESLAKRLLDEGIDRIYSSPLGRAVETAEYASKMLGLDITIEEWTKEISELVIELDGYGKSAVFHLHGELIREDLTIPKRDSWHLLPYFDNEAVRKRFKEVTMGSDDFLKRLGYIREGGRYRITKQNKDKIAVFCHGGFGVTWLSHLLEIPPPLVWSGFFLHTSSVTTVLFDERSSIWAVPRCLSVGDTSHLYKDGLVLHQNGIVANYF